MFLNAYKLYALAVKQYGAIDRPAGDRFPGCEEALVSIVVAAISLEAFINEFGGIAALLATLEGAPGWVTTLAEVLDEAENNRASITSKFQLAMLVISGRPFNRSAAPFQDFDLLVRLRNEIVHLKPYETVEETQEGDLITSEPTIIKRLAGTGALGTHPLLDEAVSAGHAVSSNWIDRVSTKAMSRWACNAVAGIVKGLINALSTSVFRDRALNAFRGFDTINY
jgi:hypothetical protein